jgi:hypothetical protein
VLYYELTASHHLFAIEPDIEITADAVDVGLRNPVRAGVLGVRVTKSDVDAGNFFILQNVANDMRARRVGANGKFADTVAVFVSAGVGAKFLAQILVLRFQGTDPIIFYFDGERVRFEIAEALAEIVAH